MRPTRRTWRHCASAGSSRWAMPMTRWRSSTPCRRPCAARRSTGDRVELRFAQGRYRRRLPRRAGRHWASPGRVVGPRAHRLPGVAGDQAKALARPRACCTSSRRRPIPGLRDADHCDRRPSAPSSINCPTRTPMVIKLLAAAKLPLPADAVASADLLSAARLGRERRRAAAAAPRRRRARRGARRAAADGARRALRHDRIQARGDRRGDQAGQGAGQPRATARCSIRWRAPIRPLPSAPRRWRPARRRARSAVISSPGPRGRADPRRADTERRASLVRARRGARALCRGARRGGAELGGACRRNGGAGNAAVDASRHRRHGARR